MPKERAENSGLLSLCISANGTQFFFQISFFVSKKDAGVDWGKMRMNKLKPKLEELHHFFHIGLR